MRFTSFAMIFTLAAAPLYAAEITTSNDTTGTTGAPAEVAAASSSTSGWVARATLTTGVDDREPIDSITTLGNDNAQVYYFTEIRDMAGETVKHRWEYKGEVMAEIPFYIGGPRWRVYSSKNLVPDWLGDWKVSVVDSSGSPLSVSTFLYTAAEAGMAAPASATDNQ